MFAGVPFVRGLDWPFAFVPVSFLRGAVDKIQATQDIGIPYRTLLSRDGNATAGTIPIDRSTRSGGPRVKSSVVTEFTRADATAR